jgi:hypothetical protein
MIQEKRSTIERNGGVVDDVARMFTLNLYLFWLILHWWTTFSYCCSPCCWCYCCLLTALILCGIAAGILALIKSSPSKQPASTKEPISIYSTGTYTPITSVFLSLLKQYSEKKEYCRTPKKYQNFWKFIINPTEPSWFSTKQLGFSIEP